ncbi:hypothetical protein BGZ63DRAFT_475891 [Mariannaea sp. PMI_226]|nr:hypothetical protein BGZ63DRAFT_475891 [Mariannaea sp. PMI_226]
MILVRNYNFYSLFQLFFALWSQAGYLSGRKRVRASLASRKLFFLSLLALLL